MKKPKVALVYDVIYPFSKGGAERRFYEMGVRMAKSGYDVHLYGMQYWDGPAEKQMDGMTLHGLCKARPVYIEGGRRSISQALIFGLSSFKLLFADYDVIDCCGFPYFSLFPAKLSAFIKRKPLYATWHEVWGKKYWNEYLGALGVFGYAVERLAAKLPNKVIAISDHTSARLKQELHVKSIVIVENGADVRHIAGLKPAKKTSDLIYVGRLMDFKRIDLIIDTLATFKKNGTRLTCTIIGKGPELAKLQLLAAKLKVAGQITWAGALQSSDDVYRAMKAATMLVLPSQREGFGLVVIEANAAGAPVLTADAPGNAAKDLIRPGRNGYVFTPSTQDLTKTIEKTLDKRAELERTSLTTAKKYDWDTLTNEVIEAYNL